MFHHLEYVIYSIITNNMTSVLNLANVTDDIAFFKSESDKKLELIKKNATDNTIYDRIVSAITEKTATSGNQYDQFEKENHSALLSTQMISAENGIAFAKELLKIENRIFEFTKSRLFAIANKNAVPLEKSQVIQGQQVTKRQFAIPVQQTTNKKTVITEQQLIVTSQPTDYVIHESEHKNECLQQELHNPIENKKIKLESSEIVTTKLNFSEQTEQEINLLFNWMHRIVWNYEKVIPSRTVYHRIKFHNHAAIIGYYTKSNVSEYKNFLPSLSRNVSRIFIRLTNTRTNLLTKQTTILISSDPSDAKFTIIAINVVLQDGNKKYFIGRVDDEYNVWWFAKNFYDDAVELFPITWKHMDTKGMPYTCIGDYRLKICDKKFDRCLRFMIPQFVINDSQ